MSGWRNSRWRQSPIALLTVVTLAGLLPVIAAASPGVAAAPATSVQASPCTGPYPIVADAYVLPAWSDAAGWSRPDQFESIVSGDVDGDGNGELVGRNANGLEIFTWAGPPAESGNPKSYAPSPGQWRQILPLDTTRTDLPSFATLDGWWDLSRSSTFRLANVDSSPADELIVRSATGLQIHRYEPSMQAFGPSIVPPGVWTDEQGWGQSHPGAYRSITTGNVDGRPGDEIVGVGPNGVEAWTFGVDGSALVRVDAGAPILVGAGWDDPQYSSTVRLGDFDGDGRDELAVRAANGLDVYRLDPASRTWTARDGIAQWGNAQASEIDRFEVGDIDANGTDDVLGAAADGFDAQTMGTSGGWQPLAPVGGYELGNFSDLDNPVHLADVLTATGLEVIGRSEDGVETFAVQGGKWVKVGPTLSQFSNDQRWGWWDQPASPDVNVEIIPANYRFDTIRPVMVRPGQQVIIARDHTGVRTFHADGTSPSAPFAPYTDLKGVPLGSDAPMDLDTLTPEARAYWYINTQLVRTYWRDQPQRTLLDQFHDLDLASKWSALQATFVDAQSTDGNGTAFDPGADQLQALNVPRGTYNAVLQDVGDWTGAVDELYTHLLGPTGVKSLIGDSFMANAAQVEHIKESFESNPALVALFGDLLWGFIAVAGAIAFATGAGEAAVAAWAAIGSIVGSGVAGGVGFYNPNGAVDTEADDLQDEIEEQFCAASQFLGESFDQIVSDYGLLTANQEAIDAMSSITGEASNRTNLIAAMNKAQDQWIWQQFANRTSGSNFWVGWCDNETGSDCPWSPGDPHTWATPDNANVTYRVIGEYVGSQGGDGNCHYDVLANNTLAGLDPPLPAFFSPRQTDTADKGQPITSGAGSIGTLGWRLGSKRCDDS